MTEIELAYIAGFFDGEGCVNLKVFTKTSGKQKGQICSEMTIEVSNNDFSVLKFINERFNGRITKRYDLKHPHTLRMESKKAVHFLQNIYPYLITKKEQARIGIEFQSLIGWSGKKVTKENMDKRISLVSSIKEVRRKINQKEDEILMRDDSLATG